jgi:hypothetical protein
MSKGGHNHIPIKICDYVSRKIKEYELFIKKGQGKIDSFKSGYEKYKNIIALFNQ